MQKEIDVSGKKVIVGELKYRDITQMADLSKEAGIKLLIMKSTNMTSEEYDNLSLKDGMIIQQAVNELNGLDSFSQIQPTKR